jgi:hypothetical protein
MAPLSFVSTGPMYLRYASFADVQAALRASETSVVTPTPRGHLAWSTGPHMCAGMNLARIEMEVMRETLLEARVTLSVAEPVHGSNSQTKMSFDRPNSVLNRSHLLMYLCQPVRRPDPTECSLSDMGPTKRFG